MKIAVAWAYAKSTCNPRYVMKFDADDFISSRLVDWLDKAEGEAGYLSNMDGFGGRVPVTSFNLPSIWTGCAVLA